MRYTLVSHGRTLGHTGIELPQQSATMRGWHFIPAPAFEEVRPVFDAMPEAMMNGMDALPTASELENIPDQERATRIREILLADPRAARFIEISGQLEALALELHDDAGAALPTQTLGVTELPMSTEAFAEVLDSVEPGAATRQPLVPPFYLLAATLG